jgi:hypothetical protein
MLYINMNEDSPYAELQAFADVNALCTKYNCGRQTDLYQMHRVAILPIFEDTMVLQKHKDGRVTLFVVSPGKMERIPIKTSDVQDSVDSYTLAKDSPSSGVTDEHIEMMKLVFSSNIAGTEVF